ncbi:hypothetical protein FSP39_005528 [Pinctada imbricata]|uniref:G-protein coupled receptors family 1 profile domain-containing protein n=1 Tax=Pinctada imbricata TaxID=66713 RepID=A0AA88YIH9_PINIB|nr:hypothetical protein FSP39_005528 [Pinctada imbricata]
MDEDMEGDPLNLSTIQPLSADHTDGLIAFSAWFSSVHGYASLLVCTFGICTNIFNITILTRKDMWTPTNLLLTWLAVSDVLTMIPYIPFAIHFYCMNNEQKPLEETFTNSWSVYMLISVNLAATTHTISIWLGVSIAVFRFLQLRSTAKGALARQRKMHQVKVVTLSVFVLSCAVLIPNYMSNKLVERQLPGNKTMYALKELQLASNETSPVVFANVVTYAIIAKIVPCILMVIFGGSLLYSLGIKGRQRRRRLSSTKLTHKKGGPKPSKTTRMLLVVIILFLITEFPQGILIFISAIVPKFYENVYIPLGDLMDFIALLNNAVNFVLYCSMSNQFRSRFLEMYLNKRRTFKDVDKSSLTQSYNSITRTALTSVSIEKKMSV